MSGYDDDDKAASSKLRGLCAATEPTRHGLSLLSANQTPSSSLAEPASLKKNTHVPITHLAYFKLPMDALTLKLNRKTDGQSKNRNTVKMRVCELKPALLAYLAL